ncbi:MAG TPA: PH domain-containing protein, partial [Bacillaceae bacterium]
MSEPKRLHPISAVYELGKSLKEMIIPFIVIFFVGGKDEGDSIWSSLPILFLAIGAVVVLVSGLLKWYRFTYRVEDGELKIEQGLFVRKKRYIPFERIQTLDLSESILHRPFGLVKVKVETAGTSLNKAEAELTAIKKEEAAALRKLIAEAKAKPADQAEETETEAADETVIYKITRKQLFFLATTSGRAGVVLSALFAFLFQFDELIPFEKVYGEVEELVRTGVALVAAIVLAGLIIAWLISVVIAFFKYNDFTVRLIGNDLVVTRGLLEKRTTTIPLHRIQAVNMKESPLRQPFGYASVYLISAGGGAFEEGSSFIELLPVVKRRDVGQILRNFLTDYQFEAELAPPPRKSMVRYMLVKTAVAA